MHASVCTRLLRHPATVPAGSFGHQQAAEGGVAAGGIHGSAVVRQGFTATRASVQKLNGLVVAALLEAGVPAVGVSPCPQWTTRHRTVVNNGCDGVAALLAAGLVPVLHGDSVMDEALGERAGASSVPRLPFSRRRASLHLRAASGVACLLPDLCLWAPPFSSRCIDAGCTVLSGDVIISSLCRHFSPPVVAFLVSPLWLAGCRVESSLAVAGSSGQPPHAVVSCGVLRVCPVPPLPPSMMQTNVPGIYDRPPQEPGAQLIARLEVAAADGAAGAAGSSSDMPALSSSDDDASGLPCGARAYTAQGDEVGSLLTSCAAHDTTGGVATKVREAAAVARLGSEVRISRAGSAAAAAAVSPDALPPGWAGTVVRLGGAEG